MRRGTKAGRRFIRRINTGCVKQFKSTKQQLEVNLENIVLIPYSFIPSETNTVKPYYVLQIPTLMKHWPAKKIKILIGHNLQSVKIVDNIQHISPLISTKRTHISSRGIYRKNLTKIPLLIPPNDRDVLCLFTINCRFVKNKTVSFSDFIVENNVDIMAITETWLGTDTDQIVLIPDGYKMCHKPRRGRKGGGVPVIARLNLKIVEEKQSCENVQFNFNTLDVSCTHRIINSECL